MQELTYTDLVAWANHPDRKLADFQKACKALGLPGDGNFETLRLRIIEFVNHLSAERQHQVASWQPIWYQRFTVYSPFNKGGNQQVDNTNNNGNAPRGRNWGCMVPIGALLVVILILWLLFLGGGSWVASRFSAASTTLPTADICSTMTISNMTPAQLAQCQVDALSLNGNGTGLNLGSGNTTNGNTDTNPSTNNGNSSTNGTNGSTLSTSSDPLTTHWTRLAQLDPTFRSSGYIAWLQAAGITFDNIVRDARQPEEETSPQGKILVSGRQVVVTNAHVRWPNIVTTDHPSYIVGKESDEFQLQPDANNGSVLYTNVTVSGPVTIWISGYSWGQFSSHFNGNIVDTTSSNTQTTPDNTPVPATTNPVSNMSCPTKADIEKLGTVIKWLDDNGVAGAQVRFNQNWDAPTWVDQLQKNAAVVTHVNKGDVASIWITTDCRSNLNK